MVGRKQENKKRHRKEPQGGLRSDRDMENVYIYIYISRFGNLMFLLREKNK
jgi:hypothetical protein